MIRLLIVRLRPFKAIAALSSQTYQILFLSKPTMSKVSFFFIRIENFENRIKFFFRFFKAQLSKSCFFNFYVICKKMKTKMKKIMVEQEFMT